MRPTRSDISGTCDRPTAERRHSLPKVTRKCNQQHIPRVLHILTGEYYQSQQANLLTRHLCFGAIPMVTFSAVQSTVQAPPTGQPCITMLSNRYASIPCQASLRPAIYGPIYGRQSLNLTHLRSTDLGSSPLYSQLKLSHHMSIQLLS